MLPVAALVSHLRLHAPDLARRLDGITGLERTPAGLRIKVSGGGWAHRELQAARDRLAAEAARVFGHGLEIEIAPGPADPERLPFPVLSSKYWNLVAFVVWDDRRWACAAVPKPEYLARWAGAVKPPAPEVLLRGELPPGGPAHALPELLDALAAEAQHRRSYVHLVTPFPGDEEADRLERVLYAAKDWGTPHTPGPVLQKYTGRLHYTDPGHPPAGVRATLGLLTGT